MFSKITVLAALSLVLSTAAHGSQTECNTGPIQCCNQLQKSDSASASTLLSSLGISVQKLTGMVGSNCSPITVIGTGSGASCSQQPVCCKNNSFNGVVAIGCTPINIGA